MNPLLREGTKIRRDGCRSHRILRHRSTIGTMRATMDGPRKMSYIVRPIPSSSKRNMARRSVFLICVLLCAAPAWGATYYVRKDGSDALCSGISDAPPSGAGSAACAFQSVQKGLDAAAAPGDTLIVHGGTYFESVSA